VRAVPREAPRGTAPFTHLTRRAADSRRFAPLAADATVSHRLLPRVHRASRASPAGPAHLQMPARSEGRVQANTPSVQRHLVSKARQRGSST